MFLDSGRIKLYFVSSISTLSLLVGMFFFVRLNPWFIPYTVFAALTAFYLIVTYVLGFIGRDFDHLKHRDLLAKWFDRAAGQHLDIYLPICGEPNRILENTWDHVQELVRTHEGVLSVYVLDDGKSPWARDEAKKRCFHYITRENNELKKAGNLRNAFKQTAGEFFVIFDADFCPSRNFLINTLPYMYEEPNTAIVQTPQFFDWDSAQTSVQMGAGAIQELFYRLIQVNRDTWKGSICVGTNAVYRRSHLEPFGGTAPIGYSEDVRTGFRLQDRGHLLAYLPIVLAKGTCPEEWRQFFTQQYRWAMGSLDLLFSKEFWKSKLTRAQKLCYLTGMMYYFTTGVSVVFAFIPSIYLLIYKPEYLHWWNLIWSLPSLLLTNVYMRLWQKTRFTWHAVEARQISYYAHLFALWDTLMNTAEAWVPTGSEAKSKRYPIFVGMAKAHVQIISYAVLGLSCYRMVQGQPFYDFLPLWALLTYHFWAIRPVVA
jgi:cellulose synthase/poly-beta-1,6-N-acetylglucosamine synthase-like glycosyltransferase